MSFTPEISGTMIGWFPVLILVLALATFGGLGAFYAVTRGKRSNTWFVLIPLLFVGFLVFQRTGRVTSTEEAIAQSGEAVSNPADSTGELWNRLTASRIILDEDPENEASAEPRPIARPDWVDKPPKRVGDVYRAVIASDPFSTEDECFGQLEQRFPREVERRLAKLVPGDQSSLVDGKSLDAMGITLDYIMREICREQFTEVLESSVGDMKQVHVMMEFTPAVEQHLLSTWQSYLRQFRVTMVAKIAAFVLALLAGAYGLLRLDTWTRGYYTSRLLVGASAAIIAIAVVLFVS